MLCLFPDDDFLLFMLVLDGVLFSFFAAPTVCVLVLFLFFFFFFFIPLYLVLSPVRLRTLAASHVHPFESPFVTLALAP